MTEIERKWKEKIWVSQISGKKTVAFPGSRLRNKK